MTSSGTTSLQSTTGANNPNSASPYPHLSNQFLMGAFYLVVVATLEVTVLEFVFQSHFSPPSSGHYFPSTYHTLTRVETSELTHTLFCLGPTLLHTSSGVPVAPPARMCTVSHCHKILPGFYRYKRCEQHRLQNRYHSKLKRVREKVVKAIGPGGSSVGSRTGGEEGEDHENNKGEGGSRNNGKGKGKEKEQEKEMRRKEKEEETQDDMEVPVMSVPIAADGGKVRGESKEVGPPFPFVHCAVIIFLCDLDRCSLHRRRSVIIRASQKGVVIFYCLECDGGRVRCVEHGRR